LVLPCTRLDTDDHWQLAEKDQVTSILQCGIHQDLIPNGSLELKRFAVSGTVETGFYLYQVQQQLLDDICIMFVMLSCFVSVLKFDWGVSHSVEICKISCVPEAPQCRLCPMHNAGWTERTCRLAGWRTTLTKIQRKWNREVTKVRYKSCLRPLWQCGYCPTPIYPPSWWICCKDSGILVTMAASNISQLLHQEWIYHDILYNETPRRDHPGQIDRAERGSTYSGERHHD